MWESITVFLLEMKIDSDLNFEKHSPMGKVKIHKREKSSLKHLPSRNLTIFSSFERFVGDK